MSDSRSAPVDSRRHQMFPTLAPAEIDRLRRFGDLRSYRSGEYLERTGEAGPGMIIVLSGEVVISERDDRKHGPPIVVHGPGSFMGELAQLSGRPSLVDGIAQGAVEAIAIPSQRLRSLLVEEADLGERIMRALILRRVRLLESGTGGPVIVGRSTHSDVVRLEGFLARNAHPLQKLDPESDPEARCLLERFQIDPSDLPIVLCPSGQILRNPSESQLARCIGLVDPIDAKKVYDVAIVGAGPAGLAAAVYAASEGLSVLVLDGRAFGGQAGASARIENYLGFPTGITGMALMARAYHQAQKFGAEMAIPDEVVRLECPPASDDARYQLVLANDERVRARSVVIASGARYRRPDVENLAAFEGACVHYWASPVEGRLCARQEVALVGAGNSAGQAAVYLAGQVSKVWLLVRGASLAASMSRYLVDRIGALANVEVLVQTEIVALEGHGSALEAIRWRHRPSGQETRRPIRHLFLFTGAVPNTAWLSQAHVELDANGFVRTGADLAGDRPALETSRPGVFAIGDVRCGSIKRVAAGVGEGAQVVSTIHAFLAQASGRVGSAADPGRG